MSFKLVLTDVVVTLDAVKKTLQNPAFSGWRILGADEGRQHFHDGQAITDKDGIRIQVPGWSYPIGITSEGKVQYDDYHGAWGNMADITKLVVYATAAELGAEFDCITQETLPNGQVLYDFA